MALEFDVPYKSKDYDAEFATTRTKYDPANFNWAGLEAAIPSFSGQLFGDTFQTFGGTSTRGGLPAWFYGGALLIGGAVVWFALKKKGK